MHTCMYMYALFDLVPAHQSGIVHFQGVHVGALLFPLCLCYQGHDGLPAGLVLHLCALHVLAHG